MYACYLSMENLDMSIYELECLLGTFSISSEIKMYGNIAIVDGLNENLVSEFSKRAGMIKKIDKVHLILNSYDKSLVRAHDWSFIDDSYSVKVTNCSSTHSKNDPFLLVHEIYYSLENPKVDLKNPKFKLNLTHNHEWYIFSEPIVKIVREESKISNPYSIKDNLAKFMINISLLDLNGPVEHPRLFDPFCGTGKIVKYAREFGIDSWGFEISGKNVAGSNDLYPQIANYVSVKNSLLLADSDQGNILVTDPPYFRNTKGKEENYLTFYNEFFSRLTDKVKSMVIIFPKKFEQSFIPTDFKLVKRFELFVHKTLIRVVYVYRR